MSTSNAYMYKTVYGFNGPGLSGPHLDYLGWIPMDRVFYFGKHSQPKSQDSTIKLSPLGEPHKNSKHYLLAMVRRIYSNKTINFINYLPFSDYTRGK